MAPTSRSAHIDPICTRCHAAGRPGDRFCGRCGAPLTTTCLACDHALPVDAEFCPRCGTAVGDAGRAESEPSGRQDRRLVTILFVDLVGFTTLGERLDPEDLRAVQQRYFDTAARAIHRRGGVVEKYIGDAVMAVFGVPVTQEDDAVRAVRCGLELQATLDGWVDGQYGPLRARVGVASGEVVADLDAVRDGGHALVAGDVVNTAARLQQHAPVGGVLVAAGTWRASTDHVEYAEQPPVAVKGKAVPLPVWRALRLVSRRWDTYPDRGPFVGRERELAGLLESLERSVAERRPHLVNLVGTAGIGKSRLLREFNRQADTAAAKTVRWVGGRCVRPGEGPVFAALSDVVTTHAGVLEADDEATARRKVRSSLSELFAGSELARLTEALTPLVGVPETTVEAEETMAAWREFFVRLAERRPLVLVMEDLYWGQPPLLRFIEHLLDDSTAAVPLLVVGTLRPDFSEVDPGWVAEGRRRRTIRLDTLATDQITRLFCELTSGAAIPEVVLPKLTELAAGTPLYAHEYVRMLADQKALPDADLNDVPLPDNVRAVVASRVDLLDPVAKKVIQSAAVFGETFWPAALQAVAGLSADETGPAVAELERREFLRPAAEPPVDGEPALAFHHIVVRDTVYRGQPRRQRLARHERAADWLQEQAAERAGEVVDAIAHHRVTALELAEKLALRPGKRVAQARLALVRAGRHAADLHATETALRLLDRALALWPAGGLEPADEIERLDADVKRWELRFHLDEANFHAIGGLAEVTAEAERLAALGANVQAGCAWTLLSEVARARADRTAAIQYIDAALSALEPTPDSAVKARAYAEAARLHMVNYEIEPGIRAAGIASAIAIRLGLPEIEMSARITEGTCRYLDGQSDGLRLLERTVDDCRRGELRALRRAAVNLAVALQEEGEIGRSYALLDESAELVIGRTSAEVLSYDDESARALYGGDWGRTVAAADAYLAASTDESSWEGLYLRTMTSWIRVLRGGEPGADLDHCLAVALRGGFKLTVASVLAHSALCRTLLDDRGGAEDNLRQLEKENAGEPYTSREWLPAAALAAARHSAGRARWLRSALSQVPRTTLWVRAARAVLDGGIAEHAGELGTAALHYGVAASIYDRMGDATDSVLAAAWAVRAAHRAGSPDSVAALAAQVHTFADRNGAVALRRLVDG